MAADDFLPIAGEGFLPIAAEGSLSLPAEGAAATVAQGSASHSDHTLLVQFARAPREGQVKTRLIPHLGAEGACELHCELTAWTGRQLLDSRLGPVELHVDGDAGHPLFARLKADGVAGIFAQRGSDLGERMYNALRDGLARFGSVILVGSDCPGIDPAYLRQATVALRGASVVLGPAADGGYVLIGARRVSASVFSGIAWGGDTVFGDTVAALERAGLEWAALPVLADIDRPSDLPVWEAVKSGRALQGA
jgi:rSAM/selenodomain-associated transferase 1